MGLITKDAMRYQVGVELNAIEATVDKVLSKFVALNSQLDGLKTMMVKAGTLYSTPDKNEVDRIKAKIFDSLK